MPEQHQESMKGTTTVGLVFDNGVILATEKRATMGSMIASKRAKKVYQVADRIAAEVITIRALGEGPQKKSLTDTLDQVALHPIFGYLAVIAVIGGLLVWTFLIGAQVSSLIAGFLSQFEQYEPVITGPLMDIIWNGAFTGFVAGVTLVIP